MTREEITTATPELLSMDKKYHELRCPYCEGTGFLIDTFDPPELVQERIDKMRERGIKCNEKLSPSGYMLTNNRCRSNYHFVTMTMNLEAQNGAERVGKG